MKFVDEATIRVDARDGGTGCLSFRRKPHYQGKPFCAGDESDCPVP